MSLDHLSILWFLARLPAELLKVNTTSKRQPQVQYPLHKWKPSFFFTEITFAKTFEPTGLLALLACVQVKDGGVSGGSKSRMQISKPLWRTFSGETLGY